MKVLLVDDDELVRTTMLDMLEDAGFEVTEAASPEEALHRNGVPHPDLLITDVNLGSSLNGFDVAAAAHRLWPAVCVLLISGLPFERTELDPRDRCLRKPFSGWRLLQAISDLMNGANNAVER
jgi:DNA-binding response OmpR family regulator